MPEGVSDISHEEGYVKKAEEVVRETNEDLGEFEQSEKERSLQANFSERYRTAEEHNSSLKAKERKVKRNLMSEEGIAYDEAILMDEEINCMLHYGEAKSRDEALQKMFLETQRGNPHYRELVGKSEEAKKNLELEQSLLMIEDPLRALIIATAEKDFLEAADELERLGLKEKASEVRDRAHQAAIEAAIRYESDKPTREKIDGKLQEAILESVLRPREEVVISLVSKNRMSLISIPNQKMMEYDRGKIENEFIDEARRRIYELLGFDYSKREFTNAEAGETMPRSMWPTAETNEKVYKTDNGTFSLKESIADYDRHKEGSQKIIITKIA
ncbi:MAG: hypothetical protein WCI63_02060 [bacterium]